MPPDVPIPDGPASDPLDLFRLDGQVAIVTGASSGIGSRLATTLAAAGARVVLAARRLDRLEQLAAQLPNAVAVRCDMADDADIAALVDATLARHGRVDVVVNNAGVTDTVPAEYEDPALFRQVVAVNLTAPFVLAQRAAVPMLERGSGSIINIASILGMRGVGQIPQAGYTASKGGLINLTRELAAQWARRGVRVNAIAPAWFPSEMTQEKMFEDEGAVRWMRRRTPMGRPGELPELDGAVLFLAGPASRYVTGVVLPVDGGWTAV
jgi:NAD(P)-dependent dehydrogenase (short-subunit alcohol dehydrogenase family)